MVGLNTARTQTPKGHNKGPFDTARRLGIYFIKGKICWRTILFDTCISEQDMVVLVVYFIGVVIYPTAVHACSDNIGLA